MCGETFVDDWYNMYEPWVEGLSYSSEQTDAFLAESRRSLSEQNISPQRAYQSST
jgi:hypothetical protein